MGDPGHSQRVRRAHNTRITPESRNLRSTPKGSLRQTYAIHNNQKSVLRLRKGQLPGKPFHVSAYYVDVAQTELVESVVRYPEILSFGA